MLFAIGIYFLYGVIAALLGGLIAGFTGKGRVTREELVEIWMDEILKLDLSDFLAGRPFLIRFLVNAMEWALAPIIGVVFCIRFINSVDRFANAKRDLG